MVLDLPGFADEVGATLRFTGEQELMALRDTLARKEIIDSDDFEFLGSKTSQYKQVGNAVPPKLAFILAAELKKFL
mgnify:CR=1 FL=1